MALISGGAKSLSAAGTLTRASPFGPETTVKGTIFSSSFTSASLRPMKRLIEKTVFSGFVTAWRFATAPTRRSPPWANATTEGVVRAPSAFSITVGSLPSSTPMHEFVVPRSIPIVLAMWCSLSPSLRGRKGVQPLLVENLSRCIADRTPLCSATASWAQSRAAGDQSFARSSFPLSSIPRSLLELHFTLLEPAGGLVGQEDAIPGVARRRLGSRGDVDRVADHAEVEPSGAAHVPGHHRARAQPDRHLDLAAELLLRRVAERERRGQGAVRVAPLAARGAEHREQPVADELVDVAAVLVHDRHRALEQPVERRDHVLRVGAGRVGVKSRMSRNIRVTSTSSPSSEVPSSRMRSATWWSTYVPNAWRIRSRSRRPSAMRLKPAWRSPSSLPS